MNLYNKKFAQVYDAIYATKDYKEEANFIKLFSHKKDKLLDVGCGTMNHSLHLSESFDYILGIDTSLEMVRAANEKVLKSGVKNVDVKNIAIEELDQNEKFELVISLFNVINHITRLTELIDFLKSAHNQLSQGGRLIFDFWNGATFRHEPPFEKSSKSIEFEDNRFEITTQTNTDLMLGTSIMISDINLTSSTVNESFKLQLPHKLWTPDLIIDILEMIKFTDIKLIPAFDLSRVANLDDKKVMVVCSK